MTTQSDPESLYLGLMSGTSMDGIDAALVALGEHTCSLRATRSVRYPEELRQALLEASRQPQRCDLDTLGSLDRWVGECFRDAALHLLEQAKIEPAAVAAIGSHGQTLRHSPDSVRPFTLQIGDPAVIVAGTGITTVSDFRRQDVATGGQGAPLAPGFHRWLFADDTNMRCVLNLGGIANITVIPPGGKNVTGFDTGPANTLLDCWSRRHLDQDYDANGAWSKSGTVVAELLDLMLDDDYFSRPAPKSTGFEYFNEAWIDNYLAQTVDRKLAPADVQATLAELTAASVAKAIDQTARQARDLLVCGGGIENTDVMARLHRRLPDLDVVSTSKFGVDPGWVECAAFAWLAMRRLQLQPGNIAPVTGAEKESVLGAAYAPGP